MDILKQFKSKMFAGLKPPVFVEILNTYCDYRGYCADCEVVIPQEQEFKRTKEIIKEVPLNPVWCGKAGQGIYALPDAGQIAVVMFINFDPAYPYITGFWQDGKRPPVTKSNNLVITDGKGGKFKIGDGLFSLINNEQSLKSILENLIDTISGIVTVGKADTQTLNPASITNLAAIKLSLNFLLKD